MSSNESLDKIDVVVFRTTYEMVYMSWDNVIEDLNIEECLRFKTIYDRFKQDYEALTIRQKNELADLREDMFYLNEDINEQLLSLGNDSGSEQSYSSSYSEDNGDGSLE